MDGWITTILILKYTCQQVLDVSTRILIQKQFTYDIYIYILAPYLDGCANKGVTFFFVFQMQWSKILSLKP
jgi:hypothetical protein